MAERLGNGLQNRLQQFESAWNLQKSGEIRAFFICRLTLVNIECAPILLFLLMKLIHNLGIYLLPRDYGRIISKNI